MAIVADYGSQLGQGGVVRQTIHRRSVVDRSNGSTANRDEKLHNGGEMKEMALRDPVKREHADDVVITAKEGALLGKEGSVGSDGDAREQKVAAMGGNTNVSLKKVK
uniref:Uncharacterized protein n=1 Tax=Arundo donax TaxID=35708 RepID=A0A0A8YZA8_ARUDO